MFTKDELECLFRVLDGEWLGIATFGLYLGKRLGDIIRLKWHQINFDQGEIRFVTGKTGRIVIDPITEPVREYPYGMLPRLTMMWLATEVVRTRQREIPLGRTYSEFLRCIGLERDAYYYRAVRDQLVRLLSANIRFSYFQQDHLEVMANRPVADDYMLWWDGQQPGQHSLWRSCVVLHDRFYRDVLEHGFPIDLDAIRAIRQSPLKLDLYTWLAYRVHALPKAVRVPWRSLHAQVGSNYADIADFKKRAKRALTAIACVHRGLNFTFVTGGLLLRPSLPPVLPRVPLSFRS